MIADRAVIRKAVGAEVAARRYQAGRTLELVRTLGDGRSERAVAAEVEMPKSTLHDRATRFRYLDVDEETFKFFNSDAGILVLQRLVDSILLFVHSVAGGGLRVVESVLRSSGLDRFAASSPSTLGIRVNTMDELIREFGEQQTADLGKTMPPRKITALQDETWPGLMHLVAMDAVSGFILVEEPAKRRDGQTWFDAMARGLSGLNAEVIQVTSDEGKGLIHHAEVLLGVQHSPDLFHVQREISKGMGAVLARSIRHAAKEAHNALSDLELLLAARLEEMKDTTVSVGRPIDWDKHLDAANARLKAAQDTLATAVELQKRFRAALTGLSQDYHPVDLDTGTLRSAKELQARLQERFAEFHAIAEEANLPEYSRKSIAKAERVMPKMVATVAFVHGEWERFVSSLMLSPKDAWQIRARLLPALYLEQIAAKTNPKNKGADLSERAAEMVRQVFATEVSHACSVLEEREALITRCRDAVLLFQRSSSPLEGRNGRLSQIHAMGRGLCNRTLRALTVIANYLATRPDGTTAAERFFAQKHASLVEWVFARMPLFAASRKTDRAPLRVVR